MENRTESVVEHSLDGEELLVRHPDAAPQVGAGHVRGRDPGHDPGHGEAGSRVHAADPGVPLAALHRHQSHLALVVRHLRHEDVQLPPVRFRM